MENTTKTNLKSNDKKEEFDIDHLSLDRVLALNAERNRELKDHYDPIAGVGCSAPRVWYTWHDKTGAPVQIMIPEKMAAVLEQSPCTSDEQWQLLRIKHDFEYWCATCVTILDKLTGRRVKMVLNVPQRRVLAVLEQQRLAGEPLRLVLLKARQWGGSTLVQIYMAWIQLVLKTNWNSLICGHLRQTSAALKGMYTRALRNYPKHLARDGNRPVLKTYEGSRNVQQLSGSESLIITGSAQNQDAIRGYDVKMAHLTEVAFWPDSTLHSPEDVIRSIGGTVPLEPLTMLVLESTANGVGNYFHSEWLRAKAGTSDKKAVFVPWTQIAIYRQPVTDVSQLLSELDDYEKWLWENGCTLEMINWYHNKRKEYPSHGLMMAEFPTTDIEAFTSTSRHVFAPELVERLRDSIPPVEPQLGDVVARGAHTLVGAEFMPACNGPMKVWRHPDSNTRMRNRYMVVVDVGGSNDSSDWSVIAVIDTHIDASFSQEELMPEVVAQWRDHVDLDLLVWKAAMIARYYCNAQLVFESNSLEATRSGVGKTLLETIMGAYPNVYQRRGKDGSRMPGFHTNRDTKPEAIYNLIAYVRDRAYIEHDKDAVNEMSTYELDPKGRYNARRGAHDDILMTRAIGLLLIERRRIEEGRSRAVTKDNFMASGGGQHTSQLAIEFLV